MRRKNLWKTKLMATVLCAVMAAEPAVIYGKAFTDGFCSESSDNEESREEQQAENEVSLNEVPQKDETLQENEILQEEGFLADPASENGDLEFYSADPEETEAVGAGNSLSGTCGTGVAWKLEDGVLTIEGEGDIDDYESVTDEDTGEVVEEILPPWENYKDQIRELYIEDGVTRIGNQAFFDCRYLEKAVVGNTVKIIGEKAFANDSALTDLTLGNSVQVILRFAFWGIAVEKLVLPASLEDISEESFCCMWDLKDIEMPDTGMLKSIDGVLYKDYGTILLVYPAGRTGEYVIPDHVRTVAENAFGNTCLTKITIPDSVEKIEREAFSYSDDLKSIIFGKGITKIPFMCCYEDEALTEVMIPEGVQTIEKWAFGSCLSLDKVMLPYSVASVESDSFEINTEVTFKNENFHQREDGSYIEGIPVKVTAKERYDYAFEVLKLINKERKKKGLKALKMDESLLDTAMQRGFETALIWDHTRPAGDDCFTANILMMGENIASGQQNPKTVMKDWMNAEGHRVDILSSEYTSAGIGCVVIEDQIYWVQCFGTKCSSTASASSHSNKTVTRSILVDKGDYRVSFEIPKISLKAGETTVIKSLWKNNLDITFELDKSGTVAESSNKSVCTVKDGKITAKAGGTATITVYYPGYKEAAFKQKIKVTGGSYKVTFNANGGKASASSRTVKAKKAVGTLPTATRAGYTFSGWYTKASGGTQITASTKITKKCTYYAQWKKVTVSKGNITKLTNGSGKKMTVTMKKVSGAAGYQVVYATNSKFTGKKTKNTSKTSLTLTDLTKNKTYYVKVRAYKKDSTGKKIYGGYSSVKKIKIKK